MRHRKAFNHLSRKAPHRKAMLANMASSLIKRKRITTTTAKAKALRSYIEPLITKSKDDTTHSRRVVFSYLQDKDAVTELFREVSPKVMERPGGYTRILKLDQNRLGDNAELAMIELVDFNPNLITEKKEKAGGTRRRRRGGKKKSTEASAEQSTEVSEEASAAEQEETKAETEEQTEEATAAEKKSDEGEIKGEETQAQTKTEEEEAADEKQTEAKASPEEMTEEKPAEEEKKDETKEDKKES